ncbi:MAG: hypothetical protein GY757_45440, partial [bacterium]|nr:hypothetical protein [bacterium]
LEKFPDKAQTSKDTRELLKNISSVLNKISDFSNLPGKEQFAEDLETIFENIKLALKQLQFNTASGKGNPFNIPTEMKESIANLQVNFSLNSAQMKEAVTQQISQLNALIEHLENSGFSADKRVEALMGKLTEIVKQLGEFKNNNQWRQIMNTLQDELKPALKDLKQMFKPADALQASKSDANTGAEAIIREKMAAAAGSVEQMEQLIDGFLEKSSAQTKSAEFLEKSSTIPKEVKNALAKLPESLKSVENLAQLSEKIQMAASKLSSAEQLPMQLLQSESRSTFPPQIKNMLNLLRSHFEPLNIGESALKLAPKLKSLVDDSGLFFEKKIQDAIARVADASARFSGIENLGQLPQIRNIINNDLKPNLAALKDFFNSEQFAADPANKEAYESIKKAVEDLMSNIDNQQNRAMDSQNKQQPMQVFSFQVPIKGEKDAQLKIFYNKGKQKEDEDDFKLSLMLDMDKLGELRTDFTHWENNLTITLFVKSYEIKGFLEENLETVREVIEPEFNSLTIQTIVSEDKIAEFDSIGQPETEIVSDKAVDVKV